MNEQIYNKIKKIADETYQAHETIKRADIAYELGMPDSNNISSLIFLAYEHFQRPESILRAIVTNTENQSVVESYELQYALNTGKTSEALEHTEKDLQHTQSALTESQHSIAAALQLELAKDAATLAKYLQGSTGLDELRTKASALMQNYGKMVSDYQNAELCVKNDIHDFVEVRSAVNSLFLQYSSALVDIFGESIKVVAPELFNFDQMKWLDTSSMQKTTQLEYDKLDQNCTMLIGEIAQHFNQTINQVPVWMKTSKALGSKGGLYGSLVMGVLSYLNHIVDAGEKTVRMKREYQTFEDSVKRDRFAINSDLLRLATVHKTINDLYIPRANAFARLSDSVLSQELQQLLDSFYSGDVRKLRNEREELLQQAHRKEQSINDHLENIELFCNQLKDCNGMITQQKENYEKALKTKPASPNILSKIFTLGFSQRKYEEDYLVWNEANGAFVEAYADALADEQEGQIDLYNHEELLEKDKADYEEIKKRIADINQSISKSLNADPAKKVALLTHLKKMIGLLRAAKAVTESRLDDSLLQPTAAPKLEDYVKLPIDIEEKVTRFTQQICDEAEKQGVKVGEVVRNELGQENGGAEGAAMTQHFIEQGAILIDSWTRLQTQSIRAQLTEAVYENELKKLREEFQKTMQQIDQKSGDLREMLKIANTSVGDNEAVRKALMEIAGIPEEQLTEADFDAILQNKKTLTI